MHGLQKALIEAQAAAAGLPLDSIVVPTDSTHNAWENAMLNYYAQLKQQGVQAVVFGDIFLEDLKAYRDKLLQQAGLQGIYPLWGQNTAQLLAQGWQAGFRAAICSAGQEWFAQDPAGAVLSADFLATHAPTADPCGENGEFHTFVFAAPYFKQPIAWHKGPSHVETYKYTITNAQGQPEAQQKHFWFTEMTLG